MGVVEPKGRPADELPAAGGGQGVDARLSSGNAYGPGGDTDPGRGEPGRVQPLVQPASIRKMVSRFYATPERAVRLAWGETAGSPVLFPAFCREKLLAYTGDRGGVAVLKNEGIPCDPVQAEAAWELWDVDTPEKMEKVREAYASLRAADGGTDPDRGITV